MTCTTLCWILLCLNGLLLGSACLHQSFVLLNIIINVINSILWIILQQGIRFSVEISEPSRGYILEVFDAHFVLPNLGPIGTDSVNAMDCWFLFSSCDVLRKCLYRLYTHPRRVAGNCKGEGF